ncbi:MAG TPA: hypothetical protein VEC35_14890 [Noviherbaspirillum sp.]|nr:hypothetical protein [Noviherbaspirillum sp.]
MDVYGDLERWLDSLPLDEAVEIDGETVFLKIHAAGAELGVCLLRTCTQTQIQDALRMGFASAITHDAGLGLSADGKDLLLTQWLPQAKRWTQAAKALENLLNQTATWRAALAPRAAESVGVADRHERRLRTLLAGGKR